MCDCQSYNGQGVFSGETPERILPFADYFPDSERKTVCVDECIADVMLELWQAGVRTAACCCGHNGQSKIGNGKPNVILAGPEYAVKAHEVLANDPRDWWVIFWA